MKATHIEERGKFRPAYIDDDGNVKLLHSEPDVYPSAPVAENVAQRLLDTIKAFNEGA